MSKVTEKMNDDKIDLQAELAKRERASQNALDETRVVSESALNVIGSEAIAPFDETQIESPQLPDEQADL